MGKFAGFQSVKVSVPRQSDFDLTHQKRVSTRMGRLTPILCKECIPSDYFFGNIEIFLRLAPLLAPIYDLIQMYVHIFFVPYRLLWDGNEGDSWETFITNGRLGVGIDPVLQPVPPFIDIQGAFVADEAFFDEGNLPDYLGVPLLKLIDPVAANWGTIRLDVMPFFAYQLIWMEYYRDRNYVPDDFMTFPQQGGEMTFSGNELRYFNRRKRSYMHDYFTSALPFTQRGAEVLIPLAGSGSVTYLAQSLMKHSDGTGFPASTTGIAAAVGAAGGNQLSGVNLTGTNDEGAARIENIDDVLIDASDVSVNDLRSAIALQVWYELVAVGGSRYSEFNQVMFGVRPQDARLQRPEYVTGMRLNVNIQEVVAPNYSQNNVDNTIPAGNMAGRGVGLIGGNSFRYFCPEYGFLVAIVSIMNPPSYHQGMPRMFYARRSFLGYPFPALAKLGEQQVDKAELYATPANFVPDADGLLPLFGYQSRYADWKYECSSNHSAFHTSLLFWTLTRHFDDTPELGSLFNEFDDSTQNRIFYAGASDVDLFWLYVQNNLTVRRALPYFGQPNTFGFV